MWARVSKLEFVEVWPSTQSVACLGNWDSPAMKRRHTSTSGIDILSDTSLHTFTRRPADHR